jgi:glycosyltransferase involved in cell wall biosynthesis
MLGAAGGLAVVRDTSELAAWVDRLLRDPAQRQAMWAAASGALQRHGDLPGRTASALLDLLPADWA